MEKPFPKNAVRSIMNLCVLSVWSWAATKALFLNVRVAEDVAGPLIRHGDLEKWLPFGLALVLILGFVPFVLATFIDEKYAWILVPVLIILAGAFIFYDSNLARQTVITLFYFHTLGFGAGLFVYSFKWRLN